jgi:hypothetical protein
VDYFFAYSPGIAVAMRRTLVCPEIRFRASKPTVRPEKSIVIRSSARRILESQSAHGSGLDRGAPIVDHPGIAAINSWGGPTKEFQVEVDPHKLEAYSVTVPQILTALGNANINVGGREIRIGQQSINIRGVGLIDDGGSDDLAQGYKVGDIENVVLTQESTASRC